jgi:hypothetical protein
VTSKYAPLCQYLLSLPPDAQEDSLSFTDIEIILGHPLPASALKYPPWWANQSAVENRPQAKAWASAGFKVDAFRLGEDGWVRFKRISAAPTIQTDQKKRAVAEHSTRMNARLEPQASVSYLPGTIALISCVATKLPGKHAARDLYISAWFKKVRKHVEQAGLAWYILSAKYGLVAPDQVIETYEMTLNNMSVQHRLKWAHDVMNKVTDQFPDSHRFALFAGARYREFLEPLLVDQGARIQVPMEGLTQGRQLNWLDTHRAYVQT